MVEVWHIVWFCLTMANADCAAKHDKVHALICCGPWTYPSEDACARAAEGLAQVSWNLDKYRLEYACRRQPDWEPYVPRRRK